MPEYERDTRLFRLFPGKFQPGPAYQVRLKNDEYGAQLMDHLRTLIERYEAGETMELVAWANPDESLSINFRARPAQEPRREAPKARNGYAEAKGGRRPRPPQPVFEEMDADPYDD